AHLAPGFRARRRIHGDLGMGRLLALVVVAETGMTDIANADRAALRLVALEKPRAAPAGDHRRQLPAEVDRVAEAGVEAKPCGRMIEVRRIAREENAAMTVVVGDNIARHPAPHRQDLVRHVLADHLPEESFGVDLIRRVIILLAGHAEAIKLAA